MFYHGFHKKILNSTTVLTIIDINKDMFLEHQISFVILHKLQQYFKILLFLFNFYFCT